MSDITPMSDIIVKIAKILNPPLKLLYNSKQIGYNCFIRKRRCAYGIFNFFRKPKSY